MGRWKEIVGKAFSPEAFDDYCHTLSWTAWRPQYVVVHNTGAPSLAQRPKGLERKHIDNLVSYYRDQKGWSAGPHLFVDDERICVFTPLTMSGVHSPSFNKVALGVEMLGDFEREPFISGRGARVRDNTVAALATLHAVLGLEPKTMKLHREDPATTHACPGILVKKLDLIQRVTDEMASRHAGEHSPA